MGDAAHSDVDPSTTPGAGHTPVRTCVGCRRRAEQSALLRVVAVTGAAPTTWELIPDVRRRGQGRGAYVHPDPQCLQTAIARRAFGRALRLPAGAQTGAGQVEAWLQQDRARQH